MFILYVIKAKHEILKLKETVAGLTDQIKILEAKLDNNYVQSKPVQQTETAPIPVTAKPILQSNKNQPTVSNIGGAQHCSLWHQRKSAIHK